jgi:hypothetical protein
MEAALPLSSVCVIRRGVAYNGRLWLPAMEVMVFVGNAMVMLLVVIIVLFCCWFVGLAR